MTEDEQAAPSGELVPLWAEQQLRNLFRDRYKRIPSSEEQLALHALWRSARAARRRPKAAVRLVAAAIARLSAPELLVKGRAAVEATDAPGATRVVVSRDLSIDGYLFAGEMAGDDFVLRAVRRHGGRLFVFPKGGYPNGQWLSGGGDHRVLVAAVAEAAGLQVGVRRLVVAVSHPALLDLVSWEELPDHGAVTV